MRGWPVAAIKQSKAHHQSGQSRRRSWLLWGLLSITLLSCEQIPTSTGSAEFESRFNDEQPALSGDGRYIAFVSNRDGSRGIWMYDLREQRYILLPRLNRRDAIAESPSLSYTGR